MSEIAVEWIAVVLFAILFVGVVIGEVLWLMREGSATTGRSIAYVVITDLLGLGIASTIVLVVFFVMFMMVMGPAGTGSNAGEASYVAALSVAIVFPPVILILLKRLFLSLLNIRSGKPAWAYSTVSSILIILFLLIPPPLVYYLIAHSMSWK